MTIGRAEAGGVQRGNRHRMLTDAERGSAASTPRRPLTEALVRAVNRPVPHDRRRRRFSDLLVEALIRKAMHGDVRAFRLNMSIVEGPFADTRPEASPIVTTPNKHDPSRGVVQMTNGPAA
jgi:hypothetical protein